MRVACGLIAFLVQICTVCRRIRVWAYVVVVSSPVISDISGCCDQPWVLKSWPSECNEGGRPCSLTSGVGSLPIWLELDSYRFFADCREWEEVSFSRPLTSIPIPCGALFRSCRDMLDPWAEFSFMVTVTDVFPHEREAPLVTI